MHEDISSRYDVLSTVQNDVGEADKLDATVEGSSTDEWNTASLRIEKVLRKVSSEKSPNRLTRANG